MFGVLENEVVNINAFYKEQDLLNQLAFGVFSTSESFNLKQKNTSSLILNRPILINNSVGETINKTKKLNNITKSKSNILDGRVKNETEALEIDLLGLSIVNTPLAFLD